MTLNDIYRLFRRGRDRYLVGPIIDIVHSLPLIEAEDMIGYISIMASTELKVRLLPILVAEVEKVGALNSKVLWATLRELRDETLVKIKDAIRAKIAAQK